MGPPGRTRRSHQRLQKGGWENIAVKPQPQERPPPVSRETGVLQWGRWKRRRCHSQEGWGYMAMEERKWKDCQILPSSSFFDVVLLLGAFVLFLNRFFLLRDRLFSFVRFLLSFVLRF